LSLSVEEIRTGAIETTTGVLRTTSAEAPARQRFAELLTLWKMEAPATVTAGDSDEEGTRESAKASELE